MKQTSKQIEQKIQKWEKKRVWETHRERERLLTLWSWVRWRRSMSSGDIILRVGTSSHPSSRSVSIWSFKIPFPTNSGNSKDAILISLSLSLFNNNPTTLSIEKLTLQTQNPSKKKNKKHTHKLKQALLAAVCSAELLLWQQSCT